MNFCRNCGAQNQPGAMNCANCGAPLGNGGYQQQAPGQGLAIAAMVCGIVSMICFPFILGVLAIIFGGIAKSKGNRGSMATAGIVLGIIGLALWIIMMVACSDTLFYMQMLNSLM